LYVAHPPSKKKLPIIKINFIGEFMFNILFYLVSGRWQLRWVKPRLDRAQSCTASSLNVITAPVFSQTKLTSAPDNHMGDVPISVEIGRSSAAGLDVMLRRSAVQELV